MLTSADDIEKLVGRVTIPSKLDEVCDLEKQKRVGTMKYEPEVDRCTEAIIAPVASSFSSLAQLRAGTRVRYTHCCGAH